MILHEQEIVNAICLHMAERKQVPPDRVSVELCWDEQLGFSAEVTVDGRNQYLVEANMLEAIERYMWKTYNRRVFRDEIRLDVEEEMIAIVSDH